MIVTFDLFSALTDSRTGGSAAFADLVVERGWRTGGDELYDAWDAANKTGQLAAAQAIATGAAPWVSFRELSARALAHAYDGFGIDADPAEDMRIVHATVPEWPLWPDVADGLAQLRGRHDLGILSNVDDDLYATTRAAALSGDGAVLFGDDHVLTSQRLRAYKPGPEIYRRAATATGGHVHVAASARDVRGALEAGLRTVRVARPGHSVDPDGPPPTYEIDDLTELDAVLRKI